MIAATYHRHGPAPEQGARADQWSRDTVATMRADGYAESAIMTKLQAYGLSWGAAQRLLSGWREECPTCGGVNDHRYPCTWGE